MHVFDRDLGGSDNWGEVHTQSESGVTSVAHMPPTPSDEMVTDVRVGGVISGPAKAVGTVPKYMITTSNPREIPTMLFFIYIFF